MKSKKANVSKYIFSFLVSTALIVSGLATINAPYAKASSPAGTLRTVDDETEGTNFFGTSIPRERINTLSFEANASTASCDTDFSYERAIGDSGVENTVWICWRNASGEVKIVTNANKVKANQDSKYLFSFMTGLFSIDFTNFDTSGILNMNSMFFQMSLPNEFSLPQGFGNLATNMDYMFALTAFPSGFSLPAGFGEEAQTMESMFTSSELPRDFSPPAGFGSQTTNMRNMFANAQFSGKLILPSEFGSRALITESMFTITNLPDGFTLPSNFGSQAINMRNMFKLSNLPSGLILPEKFAQNATSLNGIFSFVGFKGNVYWKQSMANSTADVDKMFYTAVFRSQKFIVPDKATRDLFVKSGTQGNALNVVIQSLPIAHTDTPKFADISNQLKEFQTAIKWLYKYGITTGTDKTHYSPKKTVNRGQMAMFLYREAGSPEWTQTSCGFQDTGKLSDEGKIAVCWLKSTGVTTGTDATHYSPNKTVNRGQMAMFLYRYNSSPSPVVLSCGFVDTYKMSLEGIIAVCSLKDNGVTTGTDKTHYSPNKSVTRAQMAAFLNREYNWIRK
jgi:hypothetical protein